MEDARCLKDKPRERAFKQFKSPVLNVLTILCHIWSAIAGTGVGKMDGCIDKQMNRRSNREANEKVLIRGWFVAERNHRVCKQNVSVYMAG